MMKKPVLYVFIAIIVVAQLCCAVGLFIAFDVGPMVKSTFHNLFVGNSNLNPDTDTVVIQDVFGRSGYMDNKGNVVIWPRYQGAQTFSEGLALASVGGKYGFIDKNGSFVIHPQYRFADPGFANGYVIVDTFSNDSDKSNEETIDKHGNVVIEGHLVNNLEPEGGNLLLYYSPSRKLGYIDKNWNIIIQPQYARANPFCNGIAAVEESDGGPWGFINTQGQLIAPCYFGRVNDFVDGFAAVQDPKRPLWGYVDTSGKLIIPCKYEAALHFSNGLAAVKEPKTHLWGLINTKGELVFPCKFLDYPVANGYESKFIDGLFLARTSFNQGKLIESSGNIIQDTFNVYGLDPNKPGDLSAKNPTDGWGIDLNQRFGYCGGGLHWIERQDGLLTFFDNRGNVKFTARGSTAGQFSEGLCSIGKDIVRGEEFIHGGKYGFINETGKLVIDYRFHYVQEFNNGVAKYKNGQGEYFGYIDKMGRVLWLPQEVKQDALRYGAYCLLIETLLAVFIIRSCTYKPAAIDWIMSGLYDLLFSNKH